MGKSFAINTGSLIVFDKTLGELKGFDSGMINTGSLLASKEAYEALLEKSVNINAGSTKIIDIKGQVLILHSGDALSSLADYTNRFIVIEGDLTLGEFSHHKNLETVDGLYVLGTLYYPDSFPLDAIPNLDSQSLHSYPAAAIFTVGDLHLTKERFLALAPDQLHCYSGTITAVDDSLAELENTQNISFAADGLVVREEYRNKLFATITTNHITTIPAGHEITEGLTLTPTTLPLYGDKLYLRGDLTVQASAASLVESFSSIVVEGTAWLAIAAIAPFKKIGKARKIEAFEGELVRYNGVHILTHAMLQGAVKNEMGQSIVVNGTLSIEEDVTPEDMAAIHSLYYNGLVSAPEELIPFLQKKVVSGNGQLLPLKSKDQIKDGNVIDSLLESLGADSVINTGSYTII